MMSELIRPRGAGYGLNPTKQADTIYTHLHPMDYAQHVAP